MPRNGPTLDDLLRDSLIEAVMRADRVEPQALKRLLADASARLARSPGERKGPGPLAPKPPIDRRLPPRAANAPARSRPGEPCDSALRCG